MNGTLSAYYELKICCSKFFDEIENSIYCDHVIEFAPLDIYGVMYCDLTGLNQTFFSMPCTFAAEVAICLFISFKSSS